MKPQNRATKRKRCYRKKQQTDGFLNRYNFAYTGRDTVNQLGEIGPGIIKNFLCRIKQ